MLRGVARAPALAALLGCAGSTFVHASSSVRIDVTPLDLPGQAQSSLVADPSGGYVLTWIDREAEVAHLRFATLDARGDVQERGEIASGRDWFVNWADFPSLAIADNGDWVTFFLRRTDAAQPYAYEIRATRSVDRGHTWSEPQPLHDDGTPTEHGFVSLVPEGSDRVLATWLDGRRSGGEAKPGDDAHAAHTQHGGDGGMTLRSAVLTRAGVEQAHELDQRTCDCCNTDAMRGSDGPIIVYRDRSADEIRDIHWLERSAAGWTSPAPVHADGWRIAGCPVNGPALTQADGASVIAWTTMQGDAMHVRAARRRGDATWSSPRDLEVGTAVLGRVDAAGWRDGGSLVSWIGADDAHGTPGKPFQMLRVAWLDRELDQVARIDVARLPPGRATGMPRLATDGDGAVLVWTEAGADGNRIRGVRLHAAARTATAPLESR
jgi:hypothetical protein